MPVTLFTKPVKRSSRVHGKHVTIRAVNVVRDRDRGWANAEDCIYLESYTSGLNTIDRRPSFALALSDADARLLINALERAVKP